MGYTKLRDREIVPGFEVVYGPERKFRAKVPTDYTPNGIIIDESRGFLMDKRGNLYIVDAYDRIIDVTWGHGFIPVTKY